MWANRFLRFVLVVVLGSVVLLVATSMVGFRGLLVESSGLRGVEGDENGGRRRLDEASAGPRPVMHTFYERTTADERGEINNSHLLMIDEWKKQWYAAGWEPRILSLEDARRHPDFDEIWTVVQRSGYSAYECMCYVRWLAMASVGGGFMSDYDTYPLYDFTRDGHEMPHGGDFTVYDWSIPSLMSGRASEWLRLTKGIVDNLDQRTQHPETRPAWVTTHAFSDMISLMDRQKQNPDFFIARMDVLRTITPIMDANFAPDQCKEIIPSNLRAVHFSHASSHRARESGYFPGVEERKDWDENKKRVNMAQWWLTQFNTKCNVKQ